MLEAAAFLFPTIKFMLSDAGCVLLSLFKVQELVRVVTFITVIDQTPRREEQSSWFPSRMQRSMRAGYALVSEEETNPNLALTINVQLGSSAILVWFFCSIRHSLRMPQKRQSQGSWLRRYWVARPAQHWTGAMLGLGYTILGQWANFLAFPLRAKQLDATFFQSDLTKRKWYINQLPAPRVQTTDQNALVQTEPWAASKKQDRRFAAGDIHPHISRECFRAKHAFKGGWVHCRGMSRGLRVRGGSAGPGYLE